jgi:mRNA-degrading endonuclease RelE of RelBE toxin-antitoxin system
LPLTGLAFSESSLDFLGTIPHKIRAQIIKKAKALLIDPFPVGCKRLKGVTTVKGEPVHRERSGDYRILYVKRTNPDEVVILDIDNRKDVYR